MKDIILLHGALGCSAHWDHVIPYLHDGFIYHNLNFPLHGGTPGIKKQLQREDLSEFVSAYIHERQIDNYAIAGYSMGGYVGLDLAIQQAKGLRKLITLGTKLNWAPEIAEEEIARIGLEGLAPIHAKLEQEHGANWQEVVFATHSIMRSIGHNPIKKEDFKKINIPVCLLLGEKDKMVTREETELFSGNTGTCTFEILEAQPHLLERVNGEMIAGKINSFMTVAG